MPTFSAEDLVRFKSRDLSLLDQLSWKDRASRPLEEKVRTAEALYQVARQTCPGWPRDQDRREDLEHHVWLRALFRKVSSRPFPPPKRERP